MRTLILFVCLAVAAAKECGIVGPGALEDNRIVGGVNAKPNVWTWQISLRLVSGTSDRHICGGSLITSRHVLCAAHCIDGRTASEFKVLLGATNFNAPSGKEIKLQVKSIAKHPSYNSQTINNDVSILELEREIDLDGAESHIGTVCLWDSTLPNLDGQMCKITGWGLTQYQGSSLPPNMQEANVPVVPAATCRSQYANVNTVTDGMICAGYDAGGISVCQGDSGGPLQVLYNGKYYVIGITSWGVGCAWPKYPGVFARVSTYLTYIKQNSGLA